jgi:hypothetical protein
VRGIINAQLHYPHATTITQATVCIAGSGATPNRVLAFIVGVAIKRRQRPKNVLALLKYSGCIEGLMKQKKVQFMNNLVAYGRGQGLKAGVFAFLAMTIVFAGLFITDPLNFVTTNTQSYDDCRIFWEGTSFEKIVCDKNYMTILYLNWFSFFIYFWTAFVTFWFVMIVSGLFCAPKQYADRIARDIIIFGEDNVFPDTYASDSQCNCPPEKHKHKEKP